MQPLQSHFSAPRARSRFALDFLLGPWRKSSFTYPLGSKGPRGHGIHSPAGQVAGPVRKDRGPFFRVPSLPAFLNIFPTPGCGRKCSAPKERPSLQQMGQRPGFCLPAQTQISQSLLEPMTHLSYILFSYQMKVGVQIDCSR